MGRAAVCARGVCAGTIASRNGSASVAPTLPRRNVRREMYFRVMNMSAVSLLYSHLERRALHDRGHERRKLVALPGGFPDDGSYHGHVGVLEAAAERVREQHFARRARKLLGTA